MTTLAHKVRTLQDVVDEMTSDQRELMDLIVGAAIDNAELDDDSIDEYDKLTEEQKVLIDFTVGNILAEQENKLEQDSMRVDNFLAHYGVKGMKWGMRKSDSGGAPRSLGLSKTTSTHDRLQARAKVASGQGTLRDAHKAALKSTGHRAINAFTGDKTFWKRMAVTAGVSLAAGAVLTMGPFFLPTSVAAAAGSALYPTMGTLLGAKDMAFIGALGLAGIGADVTQLGFAVATGANVVGNTVRAVRGNARISKSAANLGRDLSKRQIEGNKRTQKVLRKSGSLRKSRVENPTSAKQSDDFRVNNFLEHHATVSLGTMKSGV